MSDKINELFAFRKVAIESINKIERILKTFRMSVLKYALEGKLTEQWRRSHKGEIGSSFMLLEKIKKNRTSRKIMDEEYGHLLLF